MNKVKYNRPKVDNTAPILKSLCLRWIHQLNGQHIYKTHMSLSLIHRIKNTTVKKIVKNLQFSELLETKSMRKTLEFVNLDPITNI